MLFRDRVDAGRRLAEKLRQESLPPDAAIYGLPRGGVVLAAEVARALNLPLDLAIVRKIGHPSQPEYAICALAEGGSLVCNERERAAVDEAWFQATVERARGEIERQRKLYLGDRARVSPQDRTVVLVDDGIATGLSMRAAVEEAKTRGARRIVVAAPVMPSETADAFRRTADSVVAVETPDMFLGAVGAYYADFSPVDDEDVIRALNRDAGGWHHAEESG
jgi:putative phosphoribosyl transferase